MSRGRQAYQQQEQLPPQPWSPLGGGDVGPLTSNPHSPTEHGYDWPREGSREAERVAYSRPAQRARSSSSATDVEMSTFRDASSRGRGPVSPVDHFPPGFEPVHLPQLPQRTYSQSSTASRVPAGRASCLQIRPAQPSRSLAAGHDSDPPPMPTTVEVDDARVGALLEVLRMQLREESTLPVRPKPVTQWSCGPGATVPPHSEQGEDQQSTSWPLEGPRTRSLAGRRDVIPDRGPVNGPAPAPTSGSSSSPSTEGWTKKDMISYEEHEAANDDIRRDFDGDVVTWDGPEDPENPANWPMAKKYKTSLILSLFSFIAPFSATMVGPAIQVIGAELKIAGRAEQQLIMGMQVLAAGIGPFFIAPVIELYGRTNVIRYTHLWHLVWNTACGFASTGPQLLAFRFIGGLGSSATQIIAPGLTADIYPAHMGGRGDAVHAYLPFFGSAVAPVFGAFVTQDSNWRWIFWGTSIFSVFALGLSFLLDETYHPMLLERKAARLRSETGNQRLHTPFHDPNMTKGEWAWRRIILPYIMLVAHPIVTLPFGYRAYLFGIMYMIISSFDVNFMTVYGMDRATASLNFLALGVGFVVGLHMSRYAIDGFSAYFRRRHNTDGHQPEWRLPVNAGAALFLPPAMCLYGWSLARGLHYMVVDIAAFFLAIGLILGFFSLQPYVTESYGLEYAASAHAVGAFLQHAAEFAFPLIGPPVTSSDLGLGWSYTLLATLTLAICVVMPLLLWHLGPAIRRASTKGLPVEASARR